MNGMRLVHSAPSVTAHRPAGATTSTSTTNTSSGITPATQQQALTLIGQTLGTTAATIQALVASGNAVEIARINAASSQAIADINAQLARSTSQQQSLQLQAQLQALQQVQAQTAASSLTPAMKTGLIIGGIALVGVLGYAMLSGRARSNPVVGRGRSRRYVKPRAKSRKRRSRRAR